MILTPKPRPNKLQTCLQINIFRDQVYDFAHLSSRVNEILPAIQSRDKITTIDASSIFRNQIYTTTNEPINQLAPQG